MDFRFGPCIRKQAAPCAAALAAFAVTMAVIVTVVGLELRSHAQSRRMEALSTLSTIRARLEGALNGTMLAAQGLVALVMIRPEITGAEFEKMAEELMSRQTRIRNIGLGFGTTLKYVYPIKGNEAAIGLNYMTRPDQRPAVLRMIETGTTVVAGPVALVQGGHGIISRTPFFLPSADGTGKVYKGLVSIPMDMDGLFADAGLFRPDLPVDIAIRGKDGLGERGGIFFGDAAVFAADPVMLNIQLPAGSWQMAAVAKGGWWGRSLGFWIIGGLGVLLAILLAATTFLALRGHFRLEASERQFRNAIDDAPIPIMLHSGGSVVRINRAWTDLTDYTLAEIPSVTAWTARAYPRRAAAETTELWAGERTIRTASGDTRVWDFSSCYVTSPQREDLVVVSMAVDVTERKLAEIELRRHKDAAEQANIAKSAFLANMSHELRTPLTAIIGFSEMIHEEMLGPNASGRYREYAYDVIASGRHLLSIINDVLDVSKIEAGKMEITPRRLDVRTLIATAARVNRDAASRKGIRIATRIDDDAGTVWADDRAARQILINLMSNAVKFTPEAGSITISASAGVDGGIDVAVADTGIGIPANRLPTLMRPFEQVDNHYARTTGGTGLGLALVKGLIERHCGTVVIESTPGKGTTVTVRFPPHYADSVPAHSQG
ncbi:MAG: ATP-binding protein [Rhodospirillaceae bacterium]